jgi:hypothetical protein
MLTLKALNFNKFGFSSFNLFNYISRWTFGQNDFMVILLSYPKEMPTRQLFYSKE